MSEFPSSAKGIKPQYFQDPATDQLLNLVFSLASELSTTRDRLDALERLLARQDAVSPTAIDQFQPTEKDTVERDHSRQQFMARVMQSVEASLDSATRPDNPQHPDEIFKHLE
ncbi:MAG: hypothetical protein AB8B96_02165 [Lysobacterales bacterium]